MWMAAIFHRFGRGSQRDDSEAANYPSIQVSINQVVQSGWRRNNAHVVQGNDPRESQSLLFALARSWAWDAVTFRCETHPDEVTADSRDYLGDTVLHWVAFGSPPLAPVEALLRICPDLAKAKNRKGLLPLHGTRSSIARWLLSCHSSKPYLSHAHVANLACDGYIVACSYRASSDVVGAILDAYPEAAGIPTGNGTYPLHLLCDFGCPAGSMRHLLRTQQGIETVNFLDRTYRRRPLYILNARKSIREFQCTIESLRSKRVQLRALQRPSCRTGERDEESKRLESEIQSRIDSCKREDFWMKASMLILAEVMPNKILEDSFGDCDILNCMVRSLACPPSLQELAILLLEECLLSLSETDGESPLHYIAKTRDASTSLLLDTIAANPDAASLRNVRGELPLLLLTRHKQAWSDGVGALVHAYPPAVEEVGLKPLAYPLVWAKLEHPTALYQALRSQAIAISISS